MLVASLFHLYWFETTTLLWKQDTRRLKQYRTWLYKKRVVWIANIWNMAFQTIHLNNRKHQGIQMILIGTNQGSLLFPRVINACVLNDIIFICPSPNATIWDPFCSQELSIHVYKMISSSSPFLQIPLIYASQCYYFSFCRNRVQEHFRL